MFTNSTSGSVCSLYPVPKKYTMDHANFREELRAETNRRVIIGLRVMSCAAALTRTTLHDVLQKPMVVVALLC